MHSIDINKVAQRKKRHRAKEEDLAYGIASTRFFNSFNSKFNKAVDRQTIAYELTKDRKVFSDSFWTEDEKKIFEIWKQVQSLLNHLNDIYSTLKYVRLKGLKIFLTKNKISENEYLRFMYENHLIRISSTPDICAILGDILIQSGIPKRKINWHAFAEHSKVKNHKCSKVILEMVDKLGTLRDERHKIIHIGGHKSQIIESIESNTVDKKFLKKSPYLQKHFKISRANELKRLTKDMKAHFKVCLKYSKKFLDTLTGDVKLLKV